MRPLVGAAPLASCRIQQHHSPTRITHTYRQENLLNSHLSCDDEPLLSRTVAEDN